MNAKSLRLLRIGAVVLGWIFFGGLLMNIFNYWAIYRAYSNLAGHQINLPTNFQIFRYLEVFIAGCGNTSLAFLIAAVIRMIEKRAPVRNEIARRLMIVCCLSYVARVLPLFYSEISAAISMSNSAKGLVWLSMCFSTTMTLLVPVLYATAVFVFYTHFTKMVSFESEVA
jgi:hypothetical protein